MYNCSCCSNNNNSNTYPSIPLRLQSGNESVKQKKRKKGKKRSSHVLFMSCKSDIVFLLHGSFHIASFSLLANKRISLGTVINIGSLLAYDQFNIHYVLMNLVL